MRTAHRHSFHGLINERTMEEFQNEKNGLGDAEKKRNCMVAKCNKTFQQTDVKSHKIER